MLTLQYMYCIIPTSHLKSCALACTTDRKGLIFWRGWSSGQLVLTLCKYGQYLHTTSIQKKVMSCLGASSCCKNNGYAYISPLNILRAASKTPCLHTASSSPSSSTLLLDLCEVSLAADHSPPQLLRPVTYITENHNWQIISSRVITGNNYTFFLGDKEQIRYTGRYHNTSEYWQTTNYNVIIIFR